MPTMDVLFDDIQVAFKNLPKSFLESTLSLRILSDRRFENLYNRCLEKY